MNNERPRFVHDLRRRPPEGSQFATPESPQPRSLENAQLLTASKDHQSDPMNQSTGRATGFPRGSVPHSTGQSSFIQLPQTTTIPGMFPVQLAGHAMPDGGSLHHDAQAALHGMYATYVQPPQQHQPQMPLGYPQFPVYNQPQAYLGHGPQGTLPANMVMPMAYNTRDSISGGLQSHWGNELYPIAPNSFAAAPQLPVGHAAGYNSTRLPVAGLAQVPVAIAPSNFPNSRPLKDPELVMLPPPAPAPNRGRLTSTTESTGGKQAEKKRHRQSRKSRKANSVGSGDEEEEREGNGEARLLIIFDNTGELDLQHPPRVGKKGFVPDGLAGTFSMYSERWTFKVEYGELAQGEDGQQRYCIKWSIKNAAWEDFISILETPREALRRETRGFTLCNKVFREAMQKRAEEYEELAKKERANPKPNINQLNNFETRASYLRPQKVSEGPLLFGLRHKAVQDRYKQALNKDSDAAAVSLRARSTPVDEDALSGKNNAVKSENENEKAEAFNNDQSDSEGSSSSSAEEEVTA